MDLEELPCSLTSVPPKTSPKFKANSLEVVEFANVLHAINCIVPHCQEWAKISMLASVELSKDPLVNWLCL